MKMAPASQHSPPSAAADAFLVAASMPDHSIVEKSTLSPLQRYRRRKSSKPLTPAMSSRNGKRGSVCGFPTLCGFPTDMQISYRWVYGFLIVGFQGIGWARLFYDLKTVRPMAFGLVAGLTYCSRCMYIVVRIFKQDTESLSTLETRKVICLQALIANCPTTGSAYRAKLKIEI